MIRRFRRFGIASRIRPPLLTYLALTLAAACDSPTGLDDRLRQPPETGDGWETASLEAVGMDPARLEDLLDLMEGTSSHKIHSLLIVRNQKLVFERYWPGTDLRPEGLVPTERDFDRNSLHYVASVSKSITSALAGIAWDQGLIDSVEELLFDFFPEHADLRTGQAAQITLEHLLSFSSGLHWNEFVYGFDDPRDSHNLMFNSVDPIRHLLGRPMDTSPGAVFHYNSGDTNLVGEVVRRVSSSSTLMDFAEEQLFDPLGIDDYGWSTIGVGSDLAFASGGVSLRPRDMAKFGQMYLDDGVWNGIRIISQAWAEESVEMTIPLMGNYGTLYGYGYNWWLGRFQFGGSPVDYFRAAGWGGQDIFVIPSLEMVIVFTAGGFYEARPLDVNDLIEGYIFQAVME